MLQSARQTLPRQAIDAYTKKSCASVHVAPASDRAALVYSCIRQSWSPFGDPVMPDVVITLNRSDIGAAIDEALDAIALEPLVAGKRVAIKPNETWASEEHK